MSVIACYRQLSDHHSDSNRVISIVVQMSSHAPTGNLRWNSSGESSVSSRWAWMVSKKKFLLDTFDSDRPDLSKLPVVCAPMENFMDGRRVVPTSSNALSKEPTWVSRSWRP
jgi:hypothetical protein